MCAYAPLGSGALLRNEDVLAIADAADDGEGAPGGGGEPASRAAQMLVRWSLLRADAVVVRASGEAHVGGAARALERVAALGEGALPAAAARALDALDEGRHFCWDGSKVA